jgi:hypothetical protein
LRLDLVPPDGGADPARSPAAEGELGRAPTSTGRSPACALVAAAAGGTLAGTAPPRPGQAGA